MPEDLPVTKRIDVMVGITRSKVIYLWDFSIVKTFQPEKKSWNQPVKRCG